MSVRQYIGARYVPRFVGLFDNTQSYDALDVVDNGSGTSYIAKKPVPPGTPLTNTTYWAVYGSTNGAILDLQNRMTTAENDIDDIENYAQWLENSMTTAINVKYPDSDYNLAGAVGDGVADDTAAIDAILNYALTHDLNVFFPRGTYKISSITITFTSSHKSLNMFGEGLFSQILSTGSGITLFTPSETEWRNRCQIHNIRFMGSRGTTNNLTLLNVCYSTIQGCNFENAQMGLRLGACIGCSVIDCMFLDNVRHGLSMFGSAEENRCFNAGNNLITVIGCSSVGNLVGISCVGNSDCNFYSCSSEGNSNCGFYVEKSGGFNGRGNTIDGCWFEYNTRSHIRFITADSAADCNETISNCGFITDDNQQQVSIEVSGDNAAVLISGCHFRRLAGTKAAMVYHPNIRCVHNKFSYTPTFDEIGGEYSDITHVSINSDGSTAFGSVGITATSKVSTGTYRVSLNRWVRTVFASANGDGLIANYVAANQADGTATVDILVRNITGMVLQDASVSFMAM